MSRTRFGAVLALIFAIVATVGGQDAKQDPKKEQPKVEQPKPEPPKVDPNARKFDLRLEKDKTFFQEMNTQVTQIIKVQGQDLTQKQESTFYFKWKPTKQEGDKWFVEQEVEGLKMTIDISGNVISYDSSKADGGVTTGNTTLTQFFKALVGAKFTTILDKNQKVEKVDGKDAFIKELAAGSPQMDQLLKNIMTDDALKQMCDPTFGLTPDAPKKAGESWTRDSTLNLGPIGSYTVKYTFKYVGPATEADKKDLDKIEVDTALTYAAPKAGGDGLLFRIKEGKLATETPTKGTIFYNPKAQRIESAEIAIKLKGDLVVTIGGTDTKVELTQEQKTTVKTGDASFLNKK